MTSYKDSILAVDAGGTYLKAALVTGQHIEDGSFFKLPAYSDSGIPQIRQAYETLGEKGAETASRLGKSIRKINICIPGPFDYEKGCCLMQHKYQAIYGMPLRPFIINGIGRDMPIHFLHDSTAFLAGSIIQLQIQHLSRICGVTIGTGLGFASRIGETIQLTPKGGPGISIFSNPFRDTIAEDYVSRRGICAHYSQLTGKAPSPDVLEIADLARQGQAKARQTFLDTGICLAQILYDIISKYQFEALILGGAISKSADLLLPGLQLGLQDLPVSIYSAVDIDNAPLLGAAIS